MISKRLIAVVLLVFCMQASAFAMSGQQVYDKYKQTEKKMETKIKTLKMVVEMTTPAGVAETTIYKKGPKMRVDSVITKSANPMMGAAGQKNIVIDDGNTMTIFSPMMGKMTHPSERAEEESRKTRDVKHLGEENVSGQKCHKIKVTYQDNEIETLWISKKGYALVQEVDGDGNKTVNSDFRKIKGFLVPYSTQSYSDGSVESSSTVKSAKAGVKISDSKFDPSTVKGFDAAKGGGMKAPAGADAGAPEQVMNMMEMAMEIQRLYQAGEVEKAQALEKKMQKMVLGQ